MFVPTLMLLFVMGEAPTEAACPPLGESADRCIELTVDGPHEVPEVQLSPGLTTSLLFDSDLRPGGVSLENPRHFSVVDSGQRTLTLLPSEALRGEKPGTLTVCFADEAAPSCVSLRLLMHPAWAERQVTLLRRPRSAEALRESLREVRAENERLRAEIGQLRAARDGPGGLTGLLAAGMMSDRGIPCLHVLFPVISGALLRAGSATTCRAPGRVAIRTQVRNVSDSSWTVQGAKLLGDKGAERVGTVWPEVRLGPGDVSEVFIEARVEDAPMTGSWQLMLWDADGSRVARLGRVTFPALGP